MHPISALISFTAFSCAFSVAVADFDMSHVTSPEKIEVLAPGYSGIFEEVLNSVIFTTMTDQEKSKFQGLEVTAVKSDLKFSEFFFANVLDGQLHFSVQHISLLDELAIAMIHPANNNLAPVEYLQYLSCIDESSDDIMGAGEFFGIPSGARLTDQDQRAADQMLRVFSIWLIAEALGADFSPTEPTEYSIEVFRRLGIPPIGLATLKAVEVVSAASSDTQNTTEEIRSRLADLRLLIDRLADEQRSIARASGSRVLLAQELAGMEALATWLEAELGKTREEHLAACQS